MLHLFFKVIISFCNIFFRTQAAIERFQINSSNYWSSFNFFSFFSKQSSVSASNIISFDEILEIQKFFEFQNYYGADPPSKLSNIPISYVSAIFRFNLTKAKVKISQKIKEREEGLLLKWSDLSLELKLSQKNFRIEANIREFFVEHFNKMSHNTNESKVKLLSSDGKNGKQFVHVLFEKRKENVDFFRIYLEIGSLEFKFFPVILRRCMSYFSFSYVDENLKEQAYTHVEKLQKLTQVNVFFFFFFLIYIKFFL